MLYLTHNRHGRKLTLTRPIGTIRSLARTEGQLVASGLIDLVQLLPSLLEGRTQSLTRTFATPKMASRAQRLMYEYLWFHQDLKMVISLRVQDNVLTILLKHTPERRGRRGRK